MFADEKIEIEEIERERLIDTYIVADANCVLFYLVVCRMLIHFIILFVGWFVCFSYFELFRTRPLRTLLVT